MPPPLQMNKDLYILHTDVTRVTFILHTQQTLPTTWAAALCKV